MQPKHPHQPTDLDLLRTEAEQDRLWVELDEWYRKCPKDALSDLCNILEEGANPHLFYQMRKLPNCSLDIIRRLSLHMLREIVIRAAKRDEEDAGA